jgi:hypothetical protein
VKTLFALFAVAALAAVGCEDKKSTGKPTNATTGGTYRQTDTVRERGTTVVTDTVIHGTATVRETGTVKVTKTVTDTPKGPGLPDKDKNK